MNLTLISALLVPGTGPFEPQRKCPDSDVRGASCPPGGVYPFSWSDTMCLNLGSISSFSFHSIEVHHARHIDTVVARVQAVGFVFWRVCVCVCVYGECAVAWLD